jgi:hypothetical protein
MRKDEIQPADLCRYASELKAAVEVICKSGPFRTSAKSRQFLRYIVQRTLDGKVDELKERLIGISLLGRENSYDTGSDAGVRVRANDVRKRLAAYYSANSTDSEFALEIPAGSYVPHFYVPCVLTSSEPEPETASITEARQPSVALPQAPALSLQLLALPTLVALFLCIVCIRWQITRDHPFLTFWNTVFQDHHALLYLPPSPAGALDDVVPSSRLEDAASLFNLAGQFHSRIVITRSLDLGAGTNNVLILIGYSPAKTRDPLNGQIASDENSLAEGNRFTIDNSPFGRRVVDREAGDTSVNRYGRAGLLTISNGGKRYITIDGTDDGAIDFLIHTMCQPDTFPADLIDGFQQGTITQIVFPMEPNAQAVVFHEGTPLTHIAMNGPL